MSNETPTPTRGVPVQLDRLRHLRFPLSVLKKMQGEDTSLGNVLFLGLKGDDPDLTAEMVEDMIDLQQLPSLKDALKKATAGLVDLEVILPQMFRNEHKGDGADRPTPDGEATTP